MQQIIVRHPGSYRALQLVEAQKPAIPEGHALVKTASIGVNFADVVVRLGLYPSAKEYVGWPITPGFEFSGTIASAAPGENPEGFKKGDQVVGVMRFGAYASHVVVPYAQLFRIPPRLSLLEAGAVPVMSLTSFYALSVLGGLGSENHGSVKKVLIHSAAGGVGSTMVQMAKIWGCEVVGVVGSTKKVEFTKRLGADHVIDKSSDDWFARARDFGGEGYDLVLDANGAETMRRSYALLRPTGRLITYGAHSMLSRGSGRPNWLKLVWDYLRTPRFNPLDMVNENKSVMAFNLSYLFNEQALLRDAFGKILKWYEEGALRVPEVQSFALDDAASAHQALQSGKTMGKLTLVPQGAPDRAFLEQKAPPLVEGET